MKQQNPNLQDANYLSAKPEYFCAENRLLLCDGSVGFLNPSFTCLLLIVDFWLS